MNQRSELLQHDEHDEYTDQLDTNIKLLDELLAVSFSNMDVGLRFGERGAVEKAIKCWEQFDGIYYNDPDIKEKVRGGVVEVSHRFTRQSFEQLRKNCSPSWQGVFDGIPKQWEEINKLKRQLTKAEAGDDDTHSEEMRARVRQAQEELKAMVREIVQLATSAESYTLDKPGHAGDKRVARILLNFFHSANLETDEWSVDFAKLVQEEFAGYGADLEAKSKDSAETLKARMTMSPELADVVEDDIFVRLSDGGIAVEEPDALLKHLKSPIQSRGYRSGDRIPTQVEAEITRLSGVERILGGYLSEYSAMKEQAQKLEAAAKGLFKGKQKDQLHTFYVEAVRKLNSNLVIRNGETMSVGTIKEYPTVFARLVSQREKEAGERMEKLRAAQKKIKRN